jgi:pteridine reductase
MSDMQTSLPLGTTVLVTGAARRIGAEIATALHRAGARVVIHYRSSRSDAQTLVDSINARRIDSARAVQSNLLLDEEPEKLVAEVVDWAGRLDVLVNNASSFYPTPFGSITHEQWLDLIGSNLKVPLFLSQAAAPHLQSIRGCIVNIIDIHAQRPLRDHVVYGSAKAGLAMLTRSMAKDLAPHIRVNGVAPGAILWPENGMDVATKNLITEQIPLARQGTPEDVAAGVLFLVRDAPYVTGQIIAIDGGRSIGW